MFLRLLAMTLAVTEADDASKPYGDVSYADPGYQSDGKKRYPIDTEAHVRAAWNYINKQANQSPYSADEVSRIKARVVAAGKKYGIKFNEAASIGGGEIFKAVRAIKDEDQLSEAEADLMLGQVIASTVIAAREQQAAADMTATSDEHAPGRPANITEHLVKAHKIPESKLPDGTAARYAMHDDLPHKAAEAERIVGDIVALRERAIATDGVATIKLIAPGWGSSGYYSREVLERDVPKAFGSGTKMHWDHPTLAEERERPEGSLRTLAAETVSVPRWQDGPDGPGMYADAKVFENYRKPVDELAPHIGVSIRAAGRGREGEAEGRKGRIVEEIAHGHSVDFVTKPGAGGKVMQLFESYRQGGEMAEQTQATSTTSGGDTTTETTTETSTETKPNETEAPSTGTETQTTTTETSESDRERRRDERAALREARTIVRELLSERGGVPEPTAKRLQESIPLRFTLTTEGDLDEAKFTKLAADAIDDEIRYVAEASGVGRVRGMNSVTEGELKPEEEKAMREGLRDNLVALGSTKEQAAAAIRE